MTFHADPELLRRYRDGRLDPARAGSIEAHVVKCSTCQRHASAMVEPARLDAVWDEIVDAVDRPVPRPLERGLLWLGVTEHVARLLAVTPALTVSWLAAITSVLLLAAGASHLSTDNLVVFLTLAPLVPLVGVAVCYGPTGEPTFELALSLPFSTMRLVLLRATSVYLASLALAGLAALLLPDVGWTAAAWIAPALAVTLAAVALGTLVEHVVAFCTVATAWVIAVVVVEQLAAIPLAAFGPPAQIAWLAVAAASAAAIAARRDRFERCALRSH